MSRNLNDLRKPVMETMGEGHSRWRELQVQVQRPRGRNALQWNGFQLQCSFTVAASLGPQRDHLVSWACLKLSAKVPTYPGRQQLSEVVGPPPRSPVAKPDLSFLIPVWQWEGDILPSFPPQALAPAPAPISMATLNTILI